MTSFKFILEVRTPEAAVADIQTEIARRLTLATESQTRESRKFAAKAKAERVATLREIHEFLSMIEIRSPQ